MDASTAEKAVVSRGFLRLLRRLFLVHLHEKTENQRGGQQHDRDFKCQTPAVVAGNLVAGENREGRNAGAEGEGSVQHVERSGAAVCVFTHDAVVVVGDSTLGNAGQEHRGEQQDRRAGHEQHDEADRKQIVGNEIRALETPFDDCRAGQQTDEKVADRLRGNQRTADLIIERIGGSKVGQYRAQHDRAEAVREINEKQLSNDIAFVPADG